MMNDVLTQLNTPQRDAVTYTDGPLLVVAGAGSGKTRILTYRIVYMIQHGVPGRDILAVTFTNKAAQEMKQRVYSQVDVPVTIGTFHSICLNILRASAPKAGLAPEFSIYDDVDQLVLIKESMKELSIDDKKLNPKRVRERISAYKDFLQTPRSIENEMGGYEDQMFFPVFKRYEEKLKRYNGVDFGDIISKTVLMFLEHGEELEFWRDRYRHILVDEYQDTNHAQYVFVNLLAKKYRNITVVGDPDQSIYEWRGANIENIMNFEKDYADAKVVRLEQNYRSTNMILNAANAVIAHNVNRKSKNLWSENGDGDPIEIYRAFNDRDEARFVVTQVVAHRACGYSLRDMVVFYRIHAQSRVIEEELRRNNIQYKIIGGVKFYARKEVKDALAFLKVVANPGDELSMRRIINVPKRGVGKKAIEMIQQVSEERQVSFFNAIIVCVNEGRAAKRLSNTLGRFIDMIRSFQDKAKWESLGDLYRAILEDSGCLAELSAENTIEARMRVENLEELGNSILEFEQSLEVEKRSDALVHYLEFIGLHTGIDNWQEDEEVFTLMTLHTAKGLEFPIVFMVGLEEELLPHSNSMGGSNRQVEEERRLCYVGMTRAKEKLFMTHAGMRRIFGFEKMAEPSRFLKEIPKQTIKGFGAAAAESGVLDDIELDYDDDIDFFDDGSSRSQGKNHGRGRNRTNGDDFGENVIYY